MSLSVITSSTKDEGAYIGASVEFKVACFDASHLRMALDHWATTRPRWYSPWSRRTTAAPVNLIVVSEVIVITVVIAVDVAVVVAATAATAPAAAAATAVAVTLAATAVTIVIISFPAIAAVFVVFAAFAVAAIVAVAESPPLQ